MAAGFADSGLTIAGLKALAEAGQILLDPGLPTLVFIATNDVLRGFEILVLNQQFKFLVTLLRRLFPGISLICPEITVSLGPRVHPKPRKWLCLLKLSTL